MFKRVMAEFISSINLNGEFNSQGKNRIQSEAKLRTYSIRIEGFDPLTFSMQHIFQPSPKDIH